MLVIPGREYESDRESNHQSKTGCRLVRMKYSARIAVLWEPAPKH
jgi:hypothetical protein